MTTKTGAICELFTDDTTLKTLATGGVFDLNALDRQGLELADLTNGTPLVQPAIAVKVSSEVPYSGLAVGAAQVTVDLYFYEHAGYATCEKMRARCYALLHQKRVASTEPAGEWLFQLQWAGDITGQNDESLGGASMERSRYIGYVQK